MWNTNLKENRFTVNQNFKRRKPIIIWNHKFIETDIEGRIIRNFNTEDKCNFYDIEKRRWTKLIQMRNWDSIELNTNERIATFWLNGCTAVWIIAETKDHKYIWYIQHYPPTHHNESITKLKSEKSQIENKWWKVVKAMIMSPWDWIKQENWKYTMKYKYTAKVWEIKSILWENIIDAPYSEDQMAWNWLQWTMAIWIKDWKPYTEIEWIRKEI